MNGLAIINALQTLHDGIAAVGSAPLLAAYPVSLAPNHLSSLTFPLVFTYLDPAQWEGTSTQARHRLRTYRVVVCVARRSDDLAPTTLPLLVSLLDAFGNTYTDATKVLLNTGDPTHKVSIQVGEGDITDTGMSVGVQYAGTDCYGFEFRVRVMETV